MILIKGQRYPDYPENWERIDAIVLSLLSNAEVTNRINSKDIHEYALDIWRKEVEFYCYITEYVTQSRREKKE